MILRIIKFAIYSNSVSLIKCFNKNLNQRIKMLNASSSSNEKVNYFQILKLTEFNINRNSF